MRILHVVSLVSPQGEYGGPTRVALNQAKALRAAGHEVLIAAGTWGFDEVPTQMDGIPLRLYPATSLVPGGSFRGLTSPRLLTALPRLVEGADVVHVHLARDLVTLPAAETARRTGTPYVLQPHGMVVESTHPLSGPLDALLTKRVLRGAGRVFYLTDEDRDGAAAVAGPLRAEYLRNGIDIPAVDWAEREARDPETPTVLFLARVQEVKRPLDFVGMAVRVARDVPGARFVMVGPDGGMGPEVAAAIEAAGLGDQLRWLGPAAPEETGSHMLGADVYVLPSVLDHYPMSVLEAMAHGLPVVLTGTCGLAPLVRSGGAGIVTEPGPEGLAAGVRSLLSDRAARLRMARTAQLVARDELGMQPVVDQLQRDYRDLLSTSH